jgi:hypothetical protein
VFDQPVAMLVWLMKACSVMVPGAKFTGFLQNWSTTPAWLTFLAVLVIYKSQKI